MGLEVLFAAVAPFLPDLISSIGGLVVSPIYDFVKKKFIKGAADTPESTIGTLAVTKPEAVTAYVEALAKLEEAKIKWFNRDIVGSVSVWVSDLRAAIRPLTVIVSLACLLLDGFSAIDLSTGARVTFELCVTSWMGDRFTLRDPT
jgi:hypothetical protein